MKWRFKICYHRGNMGQKCDLDIDISKRKCPMSRLRSMIIHRKLNKKKINTMTIEFSGRKLKYKITFYFDTFIGILQSFRLRIVDTYRRRIPSQDMIALSYSVGCFCFTTRNIYGKVNWWRNTAKCELIDIIKTGDFILEVF